MKVPVFKSVPEPHSKCPWNVPALTLHLNWHTSSSTAWTQENPLGSSCAGGDQPGWAEAAPGQSTFPLLQSDVWSLGSTCTEPAGLIKCRTLFHGAWTLLHWLSAADLHRNSLNCLFAQFFFLLIHKILTFKKMLGSNATILSWNSKVFSTAMAQAPILDSSKTHTLPSHPDSGLTCRS